MKGVFHKYIFPVLRGNSSFHIFTFFLNDLTADSNTCDIYMTLGNKIEVQINILFTMHLNSLTFPCGKHFTFDTGLFVINNAIL